MEILVFAKEFKKEILEFAREFKLDFVFGVLDFIDNTKIEVLFWVFLVVLIVFIAGLFAIYRVVRSLRLSRKIRLMYQKNIDEINEKRKFREDFKNQRNQGIEVNRLNSEIEKHN